MKARLLGARYDLSFACIGPTVMRQFNKTYRHKDSATDILAFPFSSSSGEILMCKSAIAKKAPLFGMSARDYARFLFIHGCLHLKGHDHGRIMDRLEDRWCGEFRIPLPQRNGITHGSRDRRRHAPGARRGRAGHPRRRTA